MRSINVRYLLTYLHDDSDINIARYHYYYHLCSHSTGTWYCFQYCPFVGVFLSVQ